MVACKSVDRLPPTHRLNGETYSPAFAATSIPHTGYAIRNLFRRVALRLLLGRRQCCLPPILQKQEYRGILILLNCFVAADAEAPI